MSFLLGANLFLGATLLGINISHQKSLLKMVFPGGFCEISGDENILPLPPKEFGCWDLRGSNGNRPYGSIFNGIPNHQPTPKRWNHPPVGLAAASRRFEPSQGLVLGNEWPVKMDPHPGLERFFETAGKRKMNDFPMIFRFFRNFPFELGDFDFGSKFQPIHFLGFWTAMCSNIFFGGGEKQICLYKLEKNPSCVSALMSFSAPNHVSPSI